MDVRALLPPELQPMFEFERFNEVQAQCKDAFTHQYNMVISAPTGSGKTAIFELAICNLLVQIAHEKGAALSKIRSPLGCKIIYLAPIKALCSEKSTTWAKKFPFLNVGEITADSGNALRSLSTLDIICTVPEKWDSITRSNVQDTNVLKVSNSISCLGPATRVRLLLVDEVHQVGDSSRGATLEAVITRMLFTSKLLKTEGNASVPARRLRTIAASATIPNAKDVAEWIHADPSRGLKVFDQSVRPVPLDIIVHGYRQFNEWMFENYLDSRLYDVISRYSDGKSTLVFCSTRKSVKKAAKTLSDVVRQRPVNDILQNVSMRNRLQLQSVASTFRDPLLAESVPHGIAFHSADMEYQDRVLVEDLFRKNILQVICCTTTLAQGINLPAALVVIKGTRVYDQGVMKEYDSSTVNQMAGRAGRLGMQGSGRCVVMTAIDMVGHYEQVLRGHHALVDSQLKFNLVEFLNAEICRGTLKDIPSVIIWMQSTFLFVRLKNSRIIPSGPRNLITSAIAVDSELKTLALAALKSLTDVGLVSSDKDDGYDIAPNPASFVMTRYCARFETVKSFLMPDQDICAASQPKAAHGRANNATNLIILRILQTLCSAREFQDVVLRRSEKKTLNIFNKQIRFSLNEKVKNREDKLVVLLQMGLCDQSQALHEDFILRNELARLTPIASRLARCWYELIFRRSELVSNLDFRFVKNMVHLCVSIEGKSWWDSAGVLKQLSGIGSGYCRLLADAGIASFDALAKCHPRQIESIVKKKAPFASSLLEQVAKLPVLSVQIKSQKRQASSVEQSDLCDDQVTVEVEFRVENRVVQSWQPQNGVCITTHSWFYLVVGESQGAVRVCKRVRASQGWSCTETVHFPCSRECDLSMIVMFGCEETLGLEVCTTLVYKGESPPPETVPGKFMGSAYKCAHKCKDRASCKHACCKETATAKRTSRPDSEIRSLSKQRKLLHFDLPSTKKSKVRAGLTFIEDSDDENSQKSDLSFECKDKNARPLPPSFEKAKTLRNTSSLADQLSNPSGNLPEKYGVVDKVQSFPCSPNGIHPMVSKEPNSVRNVDPWAHFEDESDNLNAYSGSSDLQLQPVFDSQREPCILHGVFKEPISSSSLDARLPRSSNPGHSPCLNMGLSPNNFQRGWGQGSWAKTEHAAEGVIGHRTQHNIDQDSTSAVPFDFSELAVDPQLLALLSNADPVPASCLGPGEANAGVSHFVSRNISPDYERRLSVDEEAIYAKCFDDRSDDKISAKERYFPEEESCLGSLDDNYGMTTRVHSDRRMNSITRDPFVRGQGFHKAVGANVGDCHDVLPLATQVARKQASRSSVLPDVKNDFAPIGHPNASGKGFQNSAPASSAKDRNENSAAPGMAVPRSVDTAPLVTKGLESTANFAQKTKTAVSEEEARRALDEYTSILSAFF